MHNPRSCLNVAFQYPQFSISYPLSFLPSLFPTKDSSIHCPEARSRIGRLLNPESDIAARPTMKPCTLWQERVQWAMGQMCNGESGSANKTFSASYLLKLSTAALALFCNCLQGRRSICFGGATRKWLLGISRCTNFTGEGDLWQKGGLMFWLGSFDGNSTLIKVRVPLEQEVKTTPSLLPFHTMSMNLVLMAG